MKRLGRSVTLALFGLCFSLGVHAAPDLRWEQFEARLTVAADGHSALEVKEVVHALTSAGAAALGTRDLQFNRDLESLEEVRAELIKADGRVRSLGSEQMSTLLGAQVLPGVTQTSLETRRITFPDFVAGDAQRLTYRYQRRPALPSWVVYEQVLPPGPPWQSFRLRIEAPAAMRLSVDTHRMRVTQRVEGDTALWEVEGAFDGQALEPGATDAWWHLPRVLVSSLPSMEDMATVFGRAFGAQVRISDAVRRQALEIAGDHSDPAARVAAVLDWVRTRFRYTAVWNGTDGWVPHPLETVLNNGYGDCKDLTLVMIALLRALDIEAFPALIYTIPVYRPFPLGIGTNHVIAYLPDLQTFVDPTAFGLPMGSLPRAVQGKPAWVAFPAGGQKLLTPIETLSGPEGNRARIESHWTFAADGRARAVIEVEAQGHLGSLLKARAGALTTSPEALSRLLTALRLEGRGHVEWPTRENPGRTQRLRVVLNDLSGLLPDPQAATLALPPRLDAALSLLSGLGELSLERRSQDMECPPIQLEEQFEIDFDPAFQLRRPPSDLKVNGPLGTQFEARYTLDGQRLIGSRTLVLDTQRQVCSPEDYAARRPALRQIGQHLLRTVLVEQP